MDGVLWRGETPMRCLSELFETMDRLELPYILATNNSMKTSVDYVQKLARFGVTVDASKILTSSEAAASYVKTNHQPESVYVVGESGLHSAIRAEGINILSPADVRDGKRTPFVVMGLVRESLTYELLAMAALLMNEGADLIATNADLSLPTELGLLPGAGSIISVLTSTTGKKPSIVIGKPNSIMFTEALKRPWHNSK